MECVESRAKLNKIQAGICSALALSPRWAQLPWSMKTGALQQLTLWMHSPIKYTVYYVPKHSGQIKRSQRRAGRFDVWLVDHSVYATCRQGSSLTQTRTPHPRLLLQDAVLSVRIRGAVSFNTELGISV